MSRLRSLRWLYCCESNVRSRDMKNCWSLLMLLSLNINLNLKAE